MNHFGTFQTISKRAITRTFAIGIIGVFASLGSKGLADQNVLLDAVVASVNGKPITLSDVKANTPNLNVNSLAEAGQDTQFKKALDTIIKERLLEEDAAARKISVSEEDVEAYMAEVAKRNNMSREDFSAALAKEGLTVDRYRATIKLEIIKSKLLGQTVRSGVTVSEDELKKYFDKARPKQVAAGESYKLSQIVVTSGIDASEGVLARAQAIKKRLDDGEEFDSLADEIAKSAISASPGTVGPVAAKDLAPEIQNALKDLDEDDISAPVQIGERAFIFRLDDVDEVEESDDEANEPTEAEREEARKTLKEQKLDQKLASYFDTELPKLYPVERKL